MPLCPATEERGGLASGAVTKTRILLLTCRCLEARPMSVCQQYYHATAPPNCKNASEVFSSFFRAENLARSDVLVKRVMLTHFLFCCSSTRRRTDPVEGQFTCLTVPKALQECAEICRNCGTPQHTQHAAPYTARHAVHTPRNPPQQIVTNTYKHHGARTRPTHPCDMPWVKGGSNCDCALLSVCRVLSCISFCLSLSLHVCFVETQVSSGELNVKRKIS